jgi:hypothetical protein
MRWHVRNADGSQSGPLSEKDVWAAARGGWITAVRRDDGTVWMPIAETPFGRPPPRFADLPPDEARAVIKSAVASGAAQAMLLMTVLWGALWLWAFVLVRD